MSAFDLSKYKTVPERIVEARAAYPEGRFQTEIIELPAAFADKFIAVMSKFYRTADDPTPAVGLAWEPVPGKTPYTKDSELMNAETSAWGRALIAAFAADASKGIASREEVEARQEPPPRQQRPTATEQAPPAAVDAPPEEVAPELWSELYAHQSVWPSMGEKMKELEVRLRRLYELMELTGLWKGGSLHAALKLKADADHVSDLRQKPLFDFAVLSWQAAQERVKALETAEA